jgi:hypothetical protein
MWLENIDEAPHSNDVKSILGHRLLKAVESAFDRQPDLLAQMHRYLAKQPAPIFRRIRLRLAVYANDTATASEALLTADFWSQPGINPERQLLGNEFLHRLTDAEFELAMQRLKDAIPVGLFLDYTKRTHDRDATGDEVREFKESRLVDSYSRIANVLRGPSKVEYERLRDAHDIPEDGSKSQTWFGPTSPRMREELESMTLPEIISFLRQWRPTPGWRQHSPEGLGRTLQPLVAEQSSEYLTHAGDLATLQPVYVRNILNGLGDAVKSRTITEWESLVSLIESVVSRSGGEFPNDFVGLDSFDADADWRGLRHRIGLLLENILRGESLPVSLADRVWVLLEQLSHDPNPTPEDEARRGTMDPPNFALNSVRGAAMLGVVQYALWAHRRHTEGNLREPKPWRGALAVLSDHLDPEIDPSLAIRSIYGEYLPWLQSVDEHWVQQSIEKIFPSEVGLADLRWAAWTTYLVYCQLYQKTYMLMQHVYAEEVRKLAPLTSTDRFEIEARKHLAQHVWLLYARGHSDLTDPSSLISTFLDASSNDLKESVVSSIGRSLQVDDTITSDAIERLCALWIVLAERVESAPENDKLGILRQFGWWFASTKLDEKWSLDQLSSVLAATGGRVDPEFQVLPRLVTLSQTYPFEAINLLKRMAVAREPFHLMSIREHAREILQNALAAGRDAAEMAVEVQTDLSNQGVRDFRDLFEPPP